MTTAQVVALNPTIVALTASKATADETGGRPGEFTVTRLGDLRSPLTIGYGVSGDATKLALAVGLVLCHPTFQQR